MKNAPFGNFGRRVWHGHSIATEHHTHAQANARRRRQMERGLISEDQIRRREDMTDHPVLVGQVYEDRNRATWGDFGDGTGGSSLAPRRLIHIIDVLSNGHAVVAVRFRTEKDQKWNAATPASTRARSWKVKLSRFRNRKYYALIEEANAASA